MIKYAIFGANGGIGSACCRQLQKHNIQVDEFTRKDLNFEDIEAVSSFDLSSYSHIINATGTSIGTYQGFLRNHYSNIVTQITVNLTSNLLLLKNFINTNINGHYIWIGSNISDNPRPFHSIYGGTKLACAFATNLIAKEAENYHITEVRLGLVATNFRHTNYNGAKTKAEVAEEYKQNNAMNPDYVAEQIITGIQHKQQLINIDH